MREEQYLDRLHKLLEAQKENAPWGPLPIRKIAELWNLKGTAPALHILKKMARRGDAMVREYGKKHEYYAVEANNG